MKKLALSAIVFVFLIAVSCNKEKDCKCVSKMDGEVIGETSMTIEKGDCSDENSSITLMGITTETTCTEE